MVVNNLLTVICCWESCGVQLNLVICGTETCCVAVLEYLIAMIYGTFKVSARVLHIYYEVRVHCLKIIEFLKNFTNRIYVFLFKCEPMPPKLLNNL